MISNFSKILYRWSIWFNFQSNNEFYKIYIRYSCSDHRSTVDHLWRWSKTLYQTYFYNIRYGGRENVDKIDVHKNNQPHFHGLSVFGSTLSFVSLSYVVVGVILRFSLSLSTLSNTQHNNLLHYYIYLFNSPKHASNKQYLKNNLMILTSHTFLHSNSTSTQIFNPNSYYFSFLKIKSLFS
jgi:hypothetical protein